MPYSFSSNKQYYKRNKYWKKLIYHKKNHWANSFFFFHINHSKQKLIERRKKKWWKGLNRMGARGLLYKILYNHIMRRVKIYTLTNCRNFLSSLIIAIHYSQWRIRKKNRNKKIMSSYIHILCTYIRYNNYVNIHFYYEINKNIIL